LEWRRSRYWKQLIEGPYAWLPGLDAPYLAEEDVGLSPGIYLWTVPSTVGELVYYVGESAQGFADRMDDHLAEQLSGRYRIYKPEAFLRGKKDLLWRGVYGRGAQPNVAGFVDQLTNWAPELVKFVRAIRFHVAPTTCSDRVRERIEAALVDHLKHCEEPIRSFQDDDVRYRLRRAEEEAITVNIKWQKMLLGVPEFLEA
jgi:hypothetical protein